MHARDREREILTTELAAEALQISKDLIYRYLRIQRCDALAAPRKRVSGNRGRVLPDDGTLR